MYSLLLISYGSELCVIIDPQLGHCCLPSSFLPSFFLPAFTCCSGSFSSTAAAAAAAPPRISPSVSHPQIERYPPHSLPLLFFLSLFLLPPSASLSLFHSDLFLFPACIAGSHLKGFGLFVRLVLPVYMQHVMHKSQSRSENNKYL